MDYFIKKENYKGKKPGHHSVNTGHSVPNITLLVRKIYMKIIIIYAEISTITFLWDRKYQSI